jgi:hypothetical protein
MIHEKVYQPESESRGRRFIRGKADDNERALSTENKETQERNIRNAEKAHHTALYFIQGLCAKKTGTGTRQREGIALERRF